MKPSLLQLLLFASGLLPGQAVLADAPAPGPCGISTNTADDGSVKLSNSEDVACDAPAATPVAVPSAAPEGSANGGPDSTVASTRTSGRAPDALPDAASADVSPDQTAHAKDPREQYRDAVLLGGQGTTAANPALSRRYKAMDRATYQAKVLGGVEPGAQADPQTSADSAK